MTVTAITTTSPVQTTSSSSGTSATSAATSGDSVINSDFDTFLKMLTTQLQNQDPLDPVDNSEFAVQLATFSGVEQQAKTNDLLETLSTQIGVMGMSELAGWVGKEARADMDVWFDGDAVSIYATPEAQADTAELVVTDSSGTVVAREAMSLETNTFEWTGTDADGQPLSTGRYTLSLESFADGALIGTSAIESYGSIVEARNTGGDTTLVFPGGIEVSSDKITALREG